MHTQTQVRSFNMRSADVVGIRPSIAHFGYNLRDLWWGVPRFGSLELAVIAKQLNELCEIRLSSKHVLYAAFVKVKAVRRKLKAFFAEMALQVRQKANCRIFRLLADLKARNKFGFRNYLQCDEIWCFVGKKARRVRKSDPFRAWRSVG